MLKPLSMRRSNQTKMVLSIKRRRSKNSKKRLSFWSKT